MATELTELLERTLLEKQEKIISENIKKGVQIFDVQGALEGISISDATATASEVLQDKTAYIAEGKVTGTMPNNGILEITPLDTEQTLPQGYIESGKVKAVNIEELNEYQDCYNISNQILGYLPANCKKLEYIQCNGTQYIDTLLKPKNYKTEVKFQVINTDSTKVKDIIMSDLDEYQLTWYNNKWYYSCGAKEKQMVATNGTTLQTVIFNNDNNKISFNDVEYGECIAPVNATKNIKISNGGYRNSYARYYYVKIYDKETNTLLRDMIPIKRLDDNVICMYDKVTNQFFKNAGTGTFIAGPEVEGSNS